MSVLLVAVVPVGAAGIPASASVPAGASARGWSVTPSPNPVIPTGRLFWVSCPTASSCMAVGGSTKASGDVVALAEQWNGSKWRILPTPNPAGAAGSALFGVACSTPTACTAVGQASTGGAAQALAERWDGTRWTIQATPNPPQGGGVLSGVACTSASACTAVGATNFTPAAKTLAERWDGTRWTIQATPNPPQGGGVLASVACTSPSACTAAGFSNAGNLAERWNGTTWRIQPTPNPAGAQFTFLNTVACTSTSACTAAGAYINAAGAYQGLAERWDGTSWAIQATPHLADGAMSQLIGVACTSATGCLAVGYSNPNGNNQSPATLAERWNGSAWSIQPTPSPPGAAASNLNAASCVSSSACVAVGNTSNRRGTSLTLAQRWNGHTWSIQPTPSPAGGGALNSVSCTSLSACTAVGGRADGTTLAERWNGTRWRIQTTPTPSGSAFLSSVSCTSASACTAVGSPVDSAGNPVGTLAERWNGTSWRIVPTPNPAPSVPFVGLSAVACTSSSACMAVGGKIDSSGNGAGTLAERWNGRTWRIVPTFKPAGPGSFLNGVACTSSSACTAVGSSGAVTTLAERWDGTRWQVQATPNPPGGQNIFLASVACPTSSACTAFGLNLTGSGPLTLAERWSGGRWRIQPTPGLVAYDIGFPGVACPTLSVCYAVASYTNSGPSLTLTERWNQTGTSTHAATGRPVAAGALPPGCIRARMPGPHPSSGRIPAAAWSRYRADSFPHWAGSPSPASRIWCGAG